MTNFHFTSLSFFVFDFNSPLYILRPLKAKFEEPELTKLCCAISLDRKKSAEIKMHNRIFPVGFERQPIQN